MKTKYGTCYYASRSKIGNYCGDIENALKEGSIKIGQPPLKEGEKLLFNADEGRYFIETEN